MRKIHVFLAMLMLEDLPSGRCPKCPKSSGVIRLNMKKLRQTTRSESPPVAIPMEQKAVYELNGNGSNFTWIAPTLSSVGPQKAPTISSYQSIRMRPSGL